MDDLEDIDDLLDEVESKFCTIKPSLKSSKSQEIKTTKGKSSISAARAQKSELDDIIDGIFEDDGLVINKENTVKISNTCSSKLRCSEILIGGSNVQSGASTHVNQRSCDKLHCLSCDNKIVSFDNFKWNEEKCDYLAFRNNYPDYERLSSVLIPRKSYRAYCCQCSWVTARDLELLTKCKPTFKWVCRKH